VNTSVTPKVSTPLSGIAVAVIHNTGRNTPSQLERCAMNENEALSLTPLNVLRLVLTHRRKLIACVLFFGVLAATYSLVHKPSWKAAQAVIVRDQMTSDSDNLGRFRHADDMKTAQETIFEIIRSQWVLSHALKSIGPGSETLSGSLWPTESDVLELQQKVKISPPKGAELGKTEMFYVLVQGEQRQQAIDLTKAICQQAIHRLQMLRDTKARSIVSEVEQTVQIAQRDLIDATQKLIALEKQVGSDLSELRILHENPTGGSDLRQTLVSVENELRLAKESTRQSEELLNLLLAAQADSHSLLATGNRLLESQPALRRLKDGLVDAQLRTAALQGSMHNKHPLVESAIEAEEEVQRHLHNELATASRGVKADLRVESDRVRLLQEQSTDIRTRLQWLASLRAEYGNLVSTVSNRAAQLEIAQRNLSEAQAMLAAAQSTNLMNLVDSPETGIGPEGPSKAVIILAGLGVGLLSGIGLVFLSIPTPSPSFESYQARGSEVDWGKSSVNTFTPDAMEKEDYQPSDHYHELMK